MQRRQFIIAGIGTLAAVGMGAPAAGAARLQGAAGQVSAGGFSAVLNESFNIYDGARGVTVQLVKVKEIASAQGSRQFSLSFKGGLADGIDSGTYDVEHPAIGKVLMFLDASQRGKGAVMYRADFNLL